MQTKALWRLGNPCVQRHQVVTKGFGPRGSASSGCLSADDGSARAFVVQDFLHIGSDLVVTVAGIHFPHPNFTAPSYYKVTTDFLSGLLASRSRVLIMGDTNLNTPNSSLSLFNQLGFKGEPAASSQLFNSCCNHNAYPDDWAADRIFTNFGSYVATWKPLGCIWRTPLPRPRVVTGCWRQLVRVPSPRHDAVHPVKRSVSHSSAFPVIIHPSYECLQKW